jgi:hypothetical protein
MELKPSACTTLVGTASTDFDDIDRRLLYRRLGVFEVVLDSPKCISNIFPVDNLRYLKDS